MRGIMSFFLLNRLISPLFTFILRCHCSQSYGVSEHETYVLLEFFSDLEFFRRNNPTLTPLSRINIRSKYSEFVDQLGCEHYSLKTTRRYVDKKCLDLKIKLVQSFEQYYANIAMLKESANLVKNNGKYQVFFVRVPIFRKRNNTAQNNTDSLKIVISGVLKRMFISLKSPASSFFEDKTCRNSFISFYISHMISDVRLLDQKNKFWGLKKNIGLSLCDLSFIIDLHTLKIRNTQISSEENCQGKICIRIVLIDPEMTNHKKEIFHTTFSYPDDKISLNRNEYELKNTNIEKVIYEPTIGSQNDMQGIYNCEKEQQLNMSTQGPINNEDTYETVNIEELNTISHHIYHSKKNNNVDVGKNTDQTIGDDRNHVLLTPSAPFDISKDVNETFDCPITYSDNEKDKDIFCDYMDGSIINNNIISNELFSPTIYTKPYQISNSHNIHKGSKLQEMRTLNFFESSISVNNIESFQPSFDIIHTDVGGILIEQFLNTDISECFTGNLPFNQNEVQSNSSHDENGWIPDSKVNKEFYAPNISDNPLITKENPDGTELTEEHDLEMYWDEEITNGHQSIPSIELKGAGLSFPEDLYSEKSTIVNSVSDIFEYEMDNSNVIQYVLDRIEKNLGYYLKIVYIEDRDFSRDEQNSHEPLILTGVENNERSL